MKRYLVQFENRESYTKGHAQILNAKRLHKALPHHLLDVIYLQLSEVDSWKHRLSGVINFEKDKIFQKPKQQFQAVFFNILRQ